MALIGLNGGLIGSQRSAAIGAAYGLWTANEQVVLKRAGLWPDPDAAAYIAAVEAADGQALEAAVRAAINSFVVGCKVDGIWSAIKASCILAGARTLSGALVPLVGTAPTNNNFVSGDYNRETGLVGNTTNKSLLTGLLANSLSNTSHHLLVNGSSLSPSSTPAVNFGGVFNGSSISSLFDITGTSAYRETRSGTAGGSPGDSPTISSGLITSGSIAGCRTSSTEFRLYQNGTSAALATNSNTPSLPAIAFSVFARNDNGTQVEHNNSRLNFFSIGDGLNTSAMLSLHNRVTTLINDIAAAIP
jgi:hypothetical protein